MKFELTPGILPVRTRCRYRPERAGETESKWNKAKDPSRESKSRPGLPLN
jgi:hypothetical protein